MNFNKTQNLKFQKQLSSNNKQNKLHWNKTVTHLYKLKELQKYYDTHRPQISQQKLKNIYSKIRFDHQVNKMTAQRFKNNNYFINYGYNNFSDVNRKSSDKSKPKSSKNLSRHLSKSPTIKNNKNQLLQKQKGATNYINQDDIIEGLSKLKNKKMPVIQPQIIEYRLNKVILSERWLQQIHQQKQLSKYRKNKNIGFSQQQIKKQIMQLDQIVKMKDNNFFIENQKKIKNIFDVLHVKDINYFKNKSLIQYKFCFKSPIQKSQKFKINIERNLSNFTRNLNFQPLKSFNKQRLELLNSHQLNLNLDYLTFKDIINISISLVTPYIANNLIFGQIKTEKPLLEIDSEDDLNELNFKTNYRAQNIQRHDINIYMNLQPRKEQMEYKKKCKVIIEDIKQNIQTRKKLYGKTIKDKSLHKDISGRINNKLNYFLNLNNRTTKSKQKFSNYQLKNPGIKVKGILQTLTFKKKTQQSYRHLVPNTSKN